MMIQSISLINCDTCVCVCAENDRKARNFYYLLHSVTRAIKEKPEK